MNKNNDNGAANEQATRMAYALSHLEKADIGAANKKTISQFVNQLAAEGLTQVRQAKYIYTVILISQRLKNKPFSKVTKNDVVKVIGDINKTSFSEWTKRDYRIVFKRLMKFVREEEGKKFQRKEYPAEVNWLDITMKKSRKMLPKELLTIDDVKSLAEATLNLRDKAFILFLYESGARIGEVLGVRLKDLEPDEYGMKVSLMGKTGFRKIRIIASAPAISNWLKSHPTRNDKESWLFCGLNHETNGNQGEYRYFNKLIKKAAERAGIDKPVNPHHFRHSRATELAKKITEAQLCTYMGWEIGSREAATYVHLSGRDTDRAILALHGLAEPETEKESFTPIKCPRCGISNEPGSKFCNGCALGLDQKSVMEFDKQREIEATLGASALKNMTPEMEKIISDLVFQQVKKALAQK
jgi:integrase/recombinase XerD